MASESRNLEALSRALNLILPAGIVHEVRLAEDHFSELTSSEQAIASAMRGARRAEFSTARVMIRGLIRGMQTAAMEQSPSVLADSDGCTTWPDGLTGSISHTKGICAVALAKQDPANACLGLDIECLGRLSPQARRKICTPEEQSRIAAFCSATGVQEQHAYTLVFSAKEAFFKYQFPQTRLWLDFLDVELLSIDAKALQLQAHLLRQTHLPPHRPACYRFTDTHVATAVWHHG